MGWIVLLPALALWRVANRRFNPKGSGKKAASVLAMVLAAAAGCGYAYTKLGEWTGSGVGWLGGLLVSWTGSQDARVGVSVGLTLLAFGVAVCDVAYDKKADRAAQMAAFVVPVLLLLVIGGSMGKTGGDAVRASYQQMATIAHRIGGHK